MCANMWYKVRISQGSSKLMTANLEKETNNEGKAL